MVLGEVSGRSTPSSSTASTRSSSSRRCRTTTCGASPGLLVEQLNDNLVDRQLKIALTTEVVDWIIDVTCKDRSYGARPLRRAIQRYIEDPLSEELIRGHLAGGDIEVYLDAAALAYRPAGGREPAAAGQPSNVL